jgi:outer membrane protein OmpA-like peptidoglycan-associated protein
MANSLVDAVTGYLTPDVVQKISSFIGESPSATQKTLESIVPTILTQAADLSSSPDGANQLGNLISQGRDGNFLTNLSGQLNSDTVTQSLLNSGSGILNALFGGKLSSVIEAITSALRMKGASVSSLMKIAAPLVLGVLAKERSARGLGNSGLASLLTEQKDSLARSVPSGLAGLLGMGSGASRQVATLGTAHPYETRKSEHWWLWPVVGLAVLVLLALAFWGRDTGIKPESGKPALASIAKLTLPGGKVLSVTEGSFYHRLAGFLASASDTTVGKSFIFDNVNFEFGTAKLTPESKPTVNDLVDILTAYPSVQVRLDGHTDNVGDPAENKKLSLARAETVKEIMIASGIDASRITTAAYGEERPIASNQTEEGKAQNRRLELVIAKR